MAPWSKVLSQSLQELRVHLCQTSPASKGIREFLIGNYTEMKKANPDFPILVRECSGAEAKLVARYDFGVEKSVSIQDLDSGAVAAKLQELIKAGEGLPRSGE
ncbi:MAG: NADH:ubiquinone oxidoreductase 11 kDa subunit [Monoraphidium minutum]|nr:MAG: NADH:ubiquinone oxidoreductase 11 kDa subunit [Monoraphidium minutum]